LNFFDKLFGKQKIVTREESIKFRLSELDDWLRDKVDERKKRIYKEAAPILGEISKGIKNIKNLALEIDDLECPNEIPERVRKVIITSKPAFIRGILDAIKDVEEGPREEDLEEFNGKLQNALSTLLKVSIGKGRYLPLAFGEELERIKRESKYLFEKKKELEELIGDNELKYIEKDFEILKERFLLLSSLDRESMKFADELGKLKSERERLQSEYKGIDQTEGFKDLLEKEHRLREIKEKMRGIENYIYNLLTPLKRPLRRFRRFIQEKGTSEGISIREIEDYIQNPMGMFLSVKCRDINLLLEGIKRAIDKGELGIKEREKKKTISKINSVLSSDLEKLKEDFLFLKKEKERISKEIESSSILLKKRDLENRMARINREIALKDDEREKIKRKRGKLDGEIERLKRGLEKRLGELENKRVSLELG